MVNLITDYDKYSLFLDKSLIMLDDYAPKYTDYEQFATTGLSFMDRAVVTYNSKDLGNGYLNYLKEEGLSPTVMYFMKSYQGRKSIESLITPYHLSCLKDLIHRRNIEYLYPFMTTPLVSKVANFLGLKVYSNQEVVDNLNDKIFMKNIAEEENVKILCNYVVKNSKEAGDAFSFFHDKGGSSVIFKSSFSCGGQGNFIINNACDLKSFIDTKFENKKPFVVEPLVSVKDNPCTLFFLHPSGEINYLGTTNQIIKNKSACVGSIFPGEFEGKIHSKLIDYSFKLANRIAKTGYYGPFGFDFIVDHTNRVYFLEANVRVNYTHSMLDLYHKLNAKFGLLSDFVPSRPIKDFDYVFKKIDKADLLTKTKPGLFPFYPMYGKKTLEWFAIIVLGDSIEKVTELRNKYAQIFKVKC